MKRQSIILSAFLLLTACGGSDNTPQGNRDSAQPSISAETVVGTWAYSVESTQCTEHITFGDDQSFSARSLDEILTGSYAVAAEENADKLVFRITTQILSDNLLADCNGDSSDDSGQGEFASFFGFDDANTLVRYTNSAADVRQRVYVREN